MPRSIDAPTLKAWLADRAEIAFLDVREAGQFGEGHAFLAIPLPYSRLELELPRLVPNTRVRTVLSDAGDGIAELAARRASSLGYGNVHVLAGGTPAWARAGYTLYKGVNLPSKTFGELVEHRSHTPRITAAELDAMRRRGDNMVVVDGRSPAEYRRFSIPGGILCPNGELALRIGEIARDAATTIVVNCAGRTRSIIGAQTLIDLGVPNKVVALENGTQGWFLAGLTLERGAARMPPAAPADLGAARARARALAERRGVPTVAAATVAGWLADPARTTYVLDVRTAEEHAAGSLVGARHAPGGQLIQATDQWVGVKGARIVLADSDGVRAPVVAQWLRQLGHDASVLEGGVACGLDARRPVADSAPAVLPAITPDEAQRLHAAGAAALLDLRASMAYRRAHAAGAIWSIRPRLAAAMADAGTGAAILIADEPGIGAAAAVDLAEAGIRGVRQLAGGFEAWRAAGLAVAATPSLPADADRLDYLFFVHDRHDGNAEAARGYLAWETGLLAQLDDQERAVFRIGS